MDRRRPVPPIWGALQLSIEVIGCRFYTLPQSYSGMDTDANAALC